MQLDYNELTMIDLVKMRNRVRPATQQEFTQSALNGEVGNS